MTGIALELGNISKRFGDVIALDDVSFRAEHGTVHALLGENGAGKTTLMRIAFGLTRPDSGAMAIDGRSVAFPSPRQAIAAGMGMVHQQFSLVPAMTVAENVALGGRGRFDRRDVAASITALGKRTGLVLDPDARVGDLGNAERQKLEILRTLAHDARILILDEPTAVLTSQDTIELFTQLRSFAASGGCVVLITHKLHDALTHSDQVTVLRRGRVVMTSATGNTSRESLTTAMLGSAPDAETRGNRTREKDVKVVASLAEVVTADRRYAPASPLSLEVKAGQILGVAALEGMAASLLRVLAGRATPEQGSVAAPLKTGFVPENRQDEAIIPDFSLTENQALKGAGHRKGMLDWGGIRSQAQHVLEEFDVIADGADSPARNLSGGNQQRFVLGRELGGNPPLLVLENPTQGLDVRAAAGIHARVRSAADRGTAVVYYSSDLDELAEIADDVLVMRRSGPVLSAPDRETIGRLLLEVTETPGMNA